MSKALQPIIYVDEYVSTAEQARDYARRAVGEQNNLKQELWGLVMATPKDIVEHGKDPINEIRGRFDEIWEELWDAFINDYKYTVIADDAEYSEGSLVKQCWEKEEEERKEHDRKYQRMDDFFKKYKGVLSYNNFDDIGLFNKYDEGELELPELLTKEERDNIVKKIKEDEMKMLNDRLKEINEHE